MKKCLWMLIVLLALLPVLGAAEEGTLWLEDSRLFTREDGTVMLHLMLGKDGGAFQVDNVGVVFLDESGKTVTMEAVELAAAPLLTLPAGEHWFPVTLSAVPEGGAQVADFRLTGVYTSAAQDTPPERISGMPGYFLMQGPEHDELTAYTDAAASDDVTAYMGYAFVYDRAGAYLGNVALPQGAAVLAEGEALLTTLARVIRWEEDELRSAGFPEDAERSVIFGAIPMTDLQEGDVPGSAYVQIYTLPETAPQTLAIVGFTLDTAEDGTFTINALAQNQTGGYVRFTGVPEVALHDAQDNVRLCSELTLERPFSVLAPGETLPFTIVGRVAAGFDPVACGFRTDAVLAAAPDHEGLTTLACGADADAAAYITCMICMDEATGSLIGFEWTQPGEARIEDGVVILPDMALMETAPEDAVLLQAYYRLLPAEE